MRQLLLWDGQQQGLALPRYCPWFCPPDPRFHRSPQVSCLAVGDFEPFIRKRRSLEDSTAGSVAVRPSGSSHGDSPFCRLVILAFRKSFVRTEEATRYCVMVGAYFPAQFADGEADACGSRSIFESLVSGGRYFPRFPAVLVVWSLPGRQLTHLAFTKLESICCWPHLEATLKNTSLRDFHGLEGPAGSWTPLRFLLFPLDRSLFF